ncbi:MAG: TIR domain-containing protein [Bacilli bacterium]|nr:TIR domain-containing protein [Bacilli bacterium]
MKVYNGQGAYIYISYAHRDFERVEQLINEFYKKGYNIWYDIGIEVGTEWIEYNANKLANCTATLLFLTENYVNSVQCRNELTFAVSNRKNVIVIKFGDFPLTPGVALQLANVQYFQYNKDTDKNRLITSLFNTEILNNPKLISEDNLEFITTEELEKSITANQKIAVGVCVNNEDVLMVKRKVSEGRLCWQFPAAMTRVSESMEQKVCREVYQETGIRTTVIKSLGSRIHPDTGVAIFYYALKFAGGDLENKDDYENELVRWIPVQDYEQYITSDIFIGVKQYLKVDKND